MAYLMMTEPVSFLQQTAFGIAIGVVAALLILAVSAVRGGDTTSFATTDSGLSGYTASLVVAEIAPSGETEIYIDGELDVFVADSYVASIPTPR